ncbi:MAG: alginate export family protein [Planctomycetota bacterium]
MTIPILAPLLLALGLAPEGPADLRVGHWVEVRGEFDAAGDFVAQKVEVQSPQEYEILVGTVASAGATASGFLLLGQPISVSEKTVWRNVSPADVAGARVKVEGRWRGPLKLSAREVARRESGRDRLGGRIDEIETASGAVVLRIMQYRVRVALDVELESERPLAELALAPERVRAKSTGTIDEDDLFGRGFEIVDGVRLSGQLEGLLTREEGYDLDDAADQDRTDTELTGRIRATWNPSDAFLGVAELRHRQLWRDEEDLGSSTVGRTRLGETYGYWPSLLGSSWGVRVGRQDFDDPREWLYDQNLDAVRFLGRVRDLPIELSLSTTLSDGSPRDEEAVNAIAYLWNGDEDRHLAAWAIHRDFDLDEEEWRTHVGVRALGEWLAGHDSWLEAAVMRGRLAGQDQQGWGYDAGTTWSPDFLAPFSVTVGYALGSGGDPDSSVDHTFRQSGLQDNTAKFAGVTSFRYYGELVDPELANLGIVTAGIGARLARRTSLDLVVHQYRQDRILPFLVDAHLDQNPDGVHADLGWEADLVFGWRQLADWDLEIVGGWFRPGDAFPDGDDAYLLKFQLRRRF